MSHKHRFVVTSYQLFTNMQESFCISQWDYVILDEGHIIKNPSTKLSKAVHMLKTNHRLLLTGVTSSSRILFSLILRHRNAYSK